MKMSRYWSTILTLSCSILLLSVVSMPLESSATMVWSDDFSDGNYVGWTINGINMTAVPAVLVDGNYSADDGLLRATGEGGGWIWNLASHPSTVATGTWSFDINSPPTEPGLTHFYVFFISDDSDIATGIPDGYALKTEMIPDDHGFRGFILEKFAGNEDQQIAQYHTEQDVLGGYHVDITRDSTGLFNVWINGTHRMSGQDNTHSASGYFRFSTPAGPAIDNVEVFDSIEFDPPTTDTTPTEPGVGFPTEWLIIGVGVPVVLIVLVIIIRKTR
ncbi:MAG: hypothetical protein JSW61_09290 [Candidatus Thorarchaeota archaeon]|nr:MAG: hypothetical protein JSW61_09290 [Candidatus Thorarchaeota archaeon]